MPEGISGITYASGEQYYTVDDSGALMHPLTMTINLSTGKVASASFSPSVTLSGSDLEGIAFQSNGDNGAGSILVSDEKWATINEFSRTGTLLSSVVVPSVYGNFVSNYSLESLTIQSDNSTMWTCNEEALDVDGSLSSVASGTTVRLQKFQKAGAAWVAEEQYAYDTLPWSGDSFLTDEERSGVSDLCALPNGDLLVLERRLSGSLIPKFENHIYHVDFTDATDVSEWSGLAAASYTPVVKTLLWSDNFGVFDNFEGLCLGPQLDNGDWSLLMVSDGDGDRSESIYSLRISGVAVPEPGTVLLLVSGLLVWFGLIRPKR